MSAQWSTPVLTHSAQSTYEPEPCNPSELAARSNLREKSISELTGMIAKLSAEEEHQFIRQLTLLFLDRWTKDHCNSELVQRLLMRNTNDRIRDLWPLYIKCRDPGDKMLYWFFPLFTAWILWAVLGRRVPLILFDRLRPRGKVPTFRQLLNCLPEAVGSTATAERPPRSFANGEIAEVLERTTLFPREMVGSIDFREELGRLFCEMPGGLPNWSMAVPLCIAYGFPMNILEDMTDFLAAYKRNIPYLSHRSNTLELVLIIGYLHYEDETRPAVNEWARSQEFEAYCVDVKHRLTEKLRAVEYILLRAVHESVNIPIGNIPPITPHGNDENEIAFMKDEFGGVFPWEAKDTEIDKDKDENMAGRHLNLPSQVLSGFGSGQVRRDNDLGWVTVTFSEGNGVPQPQGSFPLAHCHFCGHPTVHIFLSYVPNPMRKGSVCFDHTVIYAAPSQHQMLRVLRVDDMPPDIFFCDDELQVFFTETNNLQDIPRSLHDVATGLQKCFLSCSLKQTLCEKILEAQEDIRHYLRKEIEYFQGKETQLLQDWPLEGPGAFARKFISLVLPLLQTYPAEVCVDATGIIRIDNPKYQSSHHIVSILPHGVEFDFRESINTALPLFVKWEELESLTQLGISFVLMKPQEVPLSERFGSHECAEGPITQESDTTAVKSLVALSVPKLGKPGQGEEQGWIIITRD